MISTVRLPATTSYRVEVSGWDTQHNFFVAKADLEWNEDNGKRLTLLQRIPDRSIVFVRLLHSADLSRALPVPYEAEEVEGTLEGHHQFRLHPVHPRHDADSYCSA